MPPRPARRRRAPATRSRARSRRAPPRLELLEPRVLLDAALPVEPAAPSFRVAWAAEMAAMLSEGRIGQAHIIATSAALDPPPTEAGTEADFTWVISHTGFRPGAAPSSVGALSPVPTTDANYSLDTPAAGQAITITTRPMVIAGMIQSGEGPDIYRISVDRPHLRIGFQPGDRASRLADRLVLYDEAGRVVGDWTVPPASGAMTVEVTGTDNQPGHEIYVGIGSESDDVSSNSSESYEILIEPIIPVSSGAPIPTDTTNTPAPPPNQAESPPRTPPPAAPPPPESAPESAPRAEAVAEVVAFSPGSLGPLPLLTAAPFGGVLGGEATIDPTETEGPLFDLALAGLLTDPPEQDEARDNNARRDPLLMISGEGVLPLLAATRARPTSAQTAPSEPATPTDGTLLVDRRFAPTNAPTPVRAVPRRSALVRRTILPVGLGVLATLATTFHLAAPISSDPAARHRRPLPSWLLRWLRERARIR